MTLTKKREKWLIDFKNGALAKIANLENELAAYKAASVEVTCKEHKQSMVGKAVTCPFCHITGLEKLIDAAAATLHGEDSDLMIEFTTKKIDIAEYRRKVISRAWGMLVKDDKGGEQAASHLVPATDMPGFVINQETCAVEPAPRPEPEMMMTTFTNDDGHVITTWVPKEQPAPRPEPSPAPQHDPFTPPVLSPPGGKTPDEITKHTTYATPDLPSTEAMMKRELYGDGKKFDDLKPKKLEKEKP